ncbi:IclR family transcriptional regulator domain-containing protein [Streptomyces sp. enrichment culture]|uniref:IclR family transcriptional regulator domain-containing protein n=1 Tax=Streptomyces sp. enrichment culture TaxID=1795815 RepID=UPI003F56815F
MERSQATAVVDRSGRMAPRGHGLRAAALPCMEELHRVTGQHILLAVRDGDEAVLVERLSARDSAEVKYRVGGRLPLTGTGIGIARWRTPPSGCGRRRWPTRTTRRSCAGSWPPSARRASAP